MGQLLEAAILAHLVCVPFGLLLIVGAKNSMEAARDQIERAVRRTGTVTAVDIERHEDPGRDVHYEPVISFRYEYRGQSYENDDYFPPTGSERGGRGWAQSIAENYETGDYVEVFVDPESPEMGFLEPEAETRGKQASIGFGVAVLLVPIGMDAWLLFG